MKVTLSRSPAHQVNHPNSAPESVTVDFGEYVVLTYAWLRCPDELEGQREDHILVYNGALFSWVVVAPFRGLEVDWLFSDLTIEQGD